MILGGLITGVTAYLIALVLVYQFQRSFMYFPPAKYYSPVEAPLPEFEEIKFETAEGTYVTAWWSAPKDNAPVFMFFHGNGSAVYSNAHIFKDLLDQGYGIWSVGYPGYPGSTGKPSETAITSAAVEQYNLLKEKGYDGERIILYGTSLGSAIAVDVARKRSVSKIILEAPFYSMYHMVKLKMPIFAFKPLVKDKYENFDALQSLEVPMLWIHGDRDRVIPIGEGRRLFDGYAGPKESLVIPGGSHVNAWVSGGREQILEFAKN